MVVENRLDTFVGRAELAMLGKSAKDPVSRSTRTHLATSRLLLTGGDTSDARRLTLRFLKCNFALLPTSWKDTRGTGSDAQETRRQIHVTSSEV